MISVVIGNTLNRDPAIIVEKTTTLRQAFDMSANFGYDGGLVQLEGNVLQYDDLDKTFADFGIEEKCFLLNVIKVDNA